MRQGIRCIVTIKETSLSSKYFETKKPEGYDKKIVVDYLHIKVEDHDAPNVEVLVKTTDYINNHIENGKPVLVHCNAGRGRTGCLGN
ncbi:protein-tyrosine phosphatase family protein [Candidatus Nitrosocosmicus arcticus]|uniref:Dual specificity protein phosphatase n=1 Tax=Candidatus Nitrosocosmicus arcticus TaxID=2035267 RepID=A0A557SWN5_9ARCH|nr:dual specificity protein phosphatase family protein [Candidatus Nitrosocosmicus arcticus]TVP41023.1 Dual specificity protein phosphatase [Candidatus Nitrosocosmicus arcticus]